jgi:hypothetical protein
MRSSEGPCAIKIKPEDYELSSRVEPANAKFVGFLGQFSKEETVIITLGLARAESGSFRAWAAVFCITFTWSGSFRAPVSAAVFVQEGSRIALTGKEVPETLDQQVALSVLLHVGALTWEHPSDKTPDRRFWAPVTFIYPMEIADMMDLIKGGR